MKKLKGRTDWMDVGVTILIFLIPSAILIASIAASFTHIKDWALDHSPKSTDDWQGWAFACIVELIPIFGVLTLWKLRRAGKPDTVARWLIGVGFVLSMAGQIAYAGGVSAGASRLIFAALPSIAGLLLTEVMLWLVRTIAEETTPAPTTTTAPAFVPPPPTLVSLPASVSTPAIAPMSTRTPEPHVPGHAPSDIEPQRPVSPWTEPPPGRDMSPDTTPDISADAPESQGVGHQDIAQVTALVPPPHVPPTEEDTEPDVLPAGQGDISPSDPPDMSRDNEDTDGGTPDDQGDRDTDVRDHDEDRDTDTDGDKDIDPRAFEALSMRTDKGMTNPQIAAHFNVTPKTITRWIKKATEAQQEPALAGSR